MQSRSGWKKVADSLALLGRTTLSFVTAVGVAIWMTVRWCLFHVHAIVIQVRIKRKMWLLGEAVYPKLVAGETVNIEDVKDQVTELVHLKDRCVQLRSNASTQRGVVPDD